MTAFQRILINTERWNETVVTPSLAKPYKLICTPNTTTRKEKKSRKRRRMTRIFDVSRFQMMSLFPLGISLEEHLPKQKIFKRHKALEMKN